MKKLTKLSALLLVAAVFIAGCKNPDDSTGGVSATPLFSESETTIDINASDIELADGNWVYKEIGTASVGTSVLEYEITLTNGDLAITKGTITQTGTFPEGTTSDYIAEYREDVESRGGTLTISGNSYTMTVVATSTQLSSAGLYLGLKLQSATGIKTNEAKTKFFYTDQGPGEDAAGNPITINYKYYLMKK